MTTRGLVTAFIAVGCCCASLASGNCTWSSWTTQECNCTEETYWSVRTCYTVNAANSTAIEYLESLELDTANCSSSCQSAKSPSCSCKTMVQTNNAEWQCQEYECQLYGAGMGEWSNWTEVSECGESFRSRDVSCIWTSPASAANHSNTSTNICGELCVSCIINPYKTNCTSVCSACVNTTYSLISSNCSSIYSIEVENVTCGVLTSWSDFSACRASSSCSSCAVGKETRRRFCTLSEQQKDATDGRCSNVKSYISEERPCNLSVVQVQGELPQLLPPVEERQVSKPKVEAKHAVEVGSSMCLIFVGFIVFIVVIDAQSIAGEAVNRMGKNLKKACKCKSSSKKL